jgi:hypothetical protein
MKTRTENKTGGSEDALRVILAAWQIREIVGRVHLLSL